MKSKQYIVPRTDGNVGVAFIEPDNVIRCENKGQSSNIYFTNVEIAICPKPLEYLEVFLHDLNFVRINERHLINILQISHYLDIDNGRFLFMNDGVKIRIAYNKRELLEKRIEAL